MISARTRANLLTAVPALDRLAVEQLEALAKGAEQLAVPRGGILIRQGDPSDAFYFVLSGRFTVHTKGTVEPIAEIAQGQPIGEIGFFAGLARTATVVALRDSSVLAFTREHFQRISDSSPGIRDALIHSLRS